MTRVSNVAQHNLIMNSIFDTQKRVYDRQIQISGGKESQTYDGIAADAQRLLTIEVTKSRTDKFIQQNQLLESRLQLMDTALDGMYQTASTLKARLIQRLNDATGSAGNLAQEAQNMLDAVAGFMNTQSNGRFLFAGTATNTQPVTFPVPDPTVFGVPDTTYYNGDSTRLTARVSETVEVTYGIPGDRQGFQQLIGSLKAAVRGDVQDDDTLLSTALDLATQAINALTDYRSEVGSTQALVNTTNARHLDYSVYAEGVVSDIENVDAAAALTALSADETLLEASFITVTRLSQLTLVNFLS